MKTIFDIKTIQALNLFEKITSIRAVHCFTYNNFFFFAIRGETKKIKKSQLELLSKKIGTGVKVITAPKGKSFDEICKFLQQLIPYPYKKITLQDKELTFFIPSTKMKAIFLGKNKTKLKQLQKILKKFFEINKISVK